MSRIPSIRCPHCDSVAATRSSRGITRTYREIYFQCQRVECGHTYKASLSIIQTLSPSAMPRADVVIPVAPRPARAYPDPANDGLAAAAEG